MESFRSLRRLPNRLTKREMESLAAICDTILPSVDVSGSQDDDLDAFYGTSASMLDVPDKMGRLLSGELIHPAVKLFRLALWLLSTWFGTFCMCGRASMSSSFPFFQGFARVEQAQREKILLSWSLSSVPLYRMFFKCIKYLVLNRYFSEVNDNNDHPSWKAIGYCGPDPAFTDQHHQQSDDVEDCVGPLHSAMLLMSDPTELVSRKLQQSGFPTPTMPSSPSPLLTLRCDVVVVGSGSGGSVVAGLLASAGHKVLVLEKGEYFARGTLSLIEGPTSRAMYEGGGLIATDNVGAIIFAGSTVGGGSTVNWSASIRTPDHVRAEWCDKFGLDVFGSKVFDRALDAVCDKMGVQSEVDEEGFNCAILRRGCEELGYPVSRVPINAPPDHYCGWCHLGCKDGKKKSTQETWLKDMADSGNGLILPGCRAIKIVRDGNIARGVIAESIHDNRRFVIESKVTVVASGALNTPGLLKRSGLKNKSIGKNLHIHPCVMAWGYFPAETGSWPEEAKKSYEGGILTTMSTAVANFDTTGYGAVIQMPALHPVMFSVLTPWTSSSDFRERMTRFSRTAHLFALARDKGAGTADYPWTVDHRLEREDEENLVRGLEVALRVLVAAGAEEVGTHHCSGERVGVKGDGKGVERLVEEVRRRGLRDLATPITSAHQMGTCRMGARPDDGAVRPSGETWEVEGLFVADTSVFPTALGVNPMVTVQAIAYCTAQSVLDSLMKKSSIS